MGRSESEQQFQEAKTHHREGRHDEALALLDDLILAHPDSPRLGYARALCLQSLGRIAEAIETCEHVLSHHEHERTRTLLGQLRATPAPAPPGRPIPWLRAGAWITVAIVAGGLAFWLPGYMERAAFQEGMADEVMQAALVDMETRFEERQAEAQLQREAAESDANIAARVLPRDDWISLALTGQPLTEPGIYEQVPSLTRDDYIFNYFLPSAYGRDEDARFPWVVISHPGGGGNFLGLTDWAEQRGVVLIVFNNSGIHYPLNPQIQQAGIYTAIELLRLDRQRGMTIGVSGGARTNWDMVNRHPDHFIGLVMIAMSQGDTGPVPDDKRVAFINGDKDFNARAVNRQVARMRRLGREFVHFEFPGGHEPGPLELRTRALDWLMER